MIYRVHVSASEWSVRAMAHWNDREHIHMCDRINESPDGSSRYYYIQINTGRFTPEHFSTSALSHAIYKDKEQRQWHKNFWRDELGKVRL